MTPHTRPPKPAVGADCWKPHPISIWSNTPAEKLAAPLATTLEFTRSCCAPGAQVKLTTAGVLQGSAAGLVRMALLPAPSVPVHWGAAAASTRFDADTALATEAWKTMPEFAAGTLTKAIAKCGSWRS